MDVFFGKIAGNHGFSHWIWGVSCQISLNQFIPSMWDGSGRRPEGMIGTQRVLKMLGKPRSFMVYHGLSWFIMVSHGILPISTWYFAYFNCLSGGYSPLSDTPRFWISLTSSKVWETCWTQLGTNSSACWNDFPEFNQKKHHEPPFASQIGLSENTSKIYRFLHNVKINKNLFGDRPHFQTQPSLFLFRKVTTNLRRLGWLKNGL